MFMRYFSFIFMFTLLNISFDPKLMAMESSSDSDTEFEWDKEDSSSSVTTEEELSHEELTTLNQDDALAHDVVVKAQGYWDDINSSDIASSEESIHDAIVISEDASPFHCLYPNSRVCQKGSSYSSLNGIYLPTEEELAKEYAAHKKKHPHDTFSVFVLGVKVQEQIQEGSYSASHDEGQFDTDSNEEIICINNSYARNKSISQMTDYIKDLGAKPLSIGDVEKLEKGSNALTKCTGSELTKLLDLLEALKESYRLSSSEQGVLYATKVRRITNLMDGIKKKLTTGKSIETLKQSKGTRMIFIDKEHTSVPTESMAGVFGGGHFPPVKGSENSFKFTSTAQNGFGQQLGYWTCRSKHEDIKDDIFKISTLFSENEVEKIWDIILLGECTTDEQGIHYVYRYGNNDGAPCYFTIIRDEKAVKNVIKTAVPIFVLDQFSITYSDNEYKCIGDKCTFFPDIDLEKVESIDCGWYPTDSKPGCLAPLCRKLTIFPENSSDKCLSKLYSDIHTEGYCFRIKDVETGDIDPEFCLMELRDWGTERTRIYVQVKCPNEMLTPQYHRAKAEKALLEKMLRVRCAILNLEAPDEVKWNIWDRYVSTLGEQLKHCRAYHYRDFGI